MGINDYKNMAENHYFIFVANQPVTDISQLLSKLGLAHYEPVEEVDLWETNNQIPCFVGITIKPNFCSS